MIVRILAGSVMALGLGFYAEGAKAGQTFICNDGRMLQVEAANIERLKHTDACVAAHFGITIKPVPLPVQRPQISASVVLKGSQKAEREQSNKRSLAAANVDFRNVPIINAGPGGQAWYRHRR